MLQSIRNANSSPPAIMIGTVGNWANDSSYAPGVSPSTVLPGRAERCSANVPARVTTNDRGRVACSTLRSNSPPPLASKNWQSDSSAKARNCGNPGSSEENPNPTRNALCAVDVNDSFIRWRRRAKPSGSASLAAPSLMAITTPPLRGNISHARVIAPTSGVMPNGSV